MIRIFETPELLATSLAEELMQTLAHLQNEKCCIAISGGSTPQLMFEKLASHPTKTGIWEAAHFFWVDERMVPQDHKDSNFGVAKMRFLQPAGIPEKNIHRIMGEQPAEYERIRYENEIRQWVRLEDGWPVFDLVLLGMGDDGHTASIFPGQLHLFSSPDWVVSSQHPVTGKSRLTLTGGTINRSRKIIFHVTGSAKAGILETIFQNKDHAKQYPAAHVNPIKGDFFWYIDREAGSKLV